MTLLKTIKRFVVSNKGHTKTALVHTLAVAEHMLEHRDWDAAATLIAGTDPKMSNQVRTIIGEVIGGVVMRKDDKHPTGMRFKLGDNFGPTAKLGVLRDLVSQDATLYSKRVNEGICGKDVVEPVARSIEDATKHITAYLSKHGFQLQGTVVALDTETA